MKNWKRRTKLALALMLVGLLSFTVGFAANNFEISGAMESFEMEDIITERFTGVEIEESSANVRILPSEDDSCILRCTVSDGVSYKTWVREGTLHIKAEHNWLKGMFSAGDMLVELHLPAKQYASIEVNTASGNIYMENISSDEIELETSSGSIFAEKLVSRELSADAVSGNIRIWESSATREADVETSSGNIRLENVSIGSLELESTSGNVELIDSMASGNAQLETTSGDLRLTRFDAGSMNIRSTSGSVRGSINSDKLFEAKSRSGEVMIPPSIKGAGACRIATTSGDIEISIAE